LTKDKTNPEYSKQPCNFSNNNYSQKTRSKLKFTIIISLVSIAVLFGGFVYFDQNMPQNPESNIEFEKYYPGPLGSDHAHTAIVIFINGDPINFAQEQFQLKSRYIHFENNNPYQIHRHATNVPLEMLFDSIGIDITNQCIIVSDKSYCDEMKFFVNEKPRFDISNYIPNHKDQILISLGEGNIPEQLEYLKSLLIHELPRETPKDNSVFI